MSTLLAKKIQSELFVKVSHVLSIAKNNSANLIALPLAVKLIVERTHKLSSFELTSCRSVNPLVVAAVVPYLSNLTHLNVEGTQFDDFGVSQLGSWVTGLLALNIARTRVSEAGLALLEDKLQDLTFCIILGNTARISPPSVLRYMG